MKKLFKLTKSLSSSIGNQGVLMLGNFTLFVILTKGMSTVMLSNFILFQAITSVIDYARLALFQNAFINLYHDQQNQKSLLRTTLILFVLSLLISLIIFLGIYLILYYSNLSLVFEMVSYYILSLIGIGAMQFINMIILAKQQHRKLFWNNFIIQSIILVSAISIFTYFKSIEIKHVILISFFASLIPILWYLPKIIFNTIGTKFNFDQAKQLLSFGKFSLGSNTLSLLVSKSDIFIVSAYANPLTIAIYHVAQKLNNYFEVPLTAVTQYYYPKAKQVSEHPISLKYYLNQSIIMQLIFIVPAAIFLFLFAEPILTLISIPAYVEQGVLVLRILLIASIVRPIGRTIGLFFDVNYRSDLNMTLLIANAILYIVLEISLIKPFGIIGLATASILSTYISTFVAHWVVRQKFQVSLIHELFKTIKIKFIKNYEIINIKLR